MGWEAVVRDAQRIDPGPYQLHLFDAAGQAPSLGGQQHRVAEPGQADDLSGHDVQRQRVFRRQEQPHGAGRAGGSRPLALHGQHRVHEVQPGRGPERQIQQHVGKLPLILVAGVEPHFGYAGDQPEVVFHRAGHAHKQMGL